MRVYDCSVPKMFLWDVALHGELCEIVFVVNQPNHHVHIHLM